MTKSQDTIVALQVQNNSAEKFMTKCIYAVNRFYLL